jgi:hypothetical protein
MGKTYERQWYALVLWRLEDICADRPDLTREQVREVLAGAEVLIMDVMIEAGYSYIQSIFEQVYPTEGGEDAGQEG